MDADRFVQAATGRKAGPYAWFVLGVLTLAYLFSFLDRMVVNLLVEPMRRDLGVSDTQVSLLMGFAFALFYTLCGLPLGWLADRAHRRRMIVAGITVWSAMTVACGFARTYGQLFAARVGVGAGEAALTPAAHSLIADYFPPQQLGRAMSIYALGIYLGSGVALLLGALAIQLAGVRDVWTLPLVGPVFPWQMVFVIVGLPGLLVALLLLAVREPSRTSIAAGVESPKGTSDWFRSERRFLLLHHGGFGLLSLVAYASAAWIPTAFVRSFGWTSVQAALVQGACVVTLSVAGCIAGGVLSDRLARRGGAAARLRVGAMAGAGLMVSMPVFALAPTAGLAVAALMPVSFFVAMPFGAAPAALAERAPPPLRGRAAAVYLLAVSVIGIGIGPTAVALCTDHLFGDAASLRWSIGLVCGVASAVAALLLRAGSAVGHATPTHTEA